MTIEPLLFFDLIVTVFVLGISLAVLAVFYARMLKRFHTLMLEQERVRMGMHKKSLDLLDDAQKRSSDVIEKAQVKALQLINSAQFYSDESKHVFEEELKYARENQTKEFEKVSSKNT